MKIQAFSDPELYLLSNWDSGILLERSLNDVREKYQKIFSTALDQLGRKFKVLNQRGIHLSGEYDLSVGIGKESWPSTYSSWPSGFWLGCVTLDDLTSEDKEAPFACVWFNPPKSKGMDLGAAAERLREAARTILTNEQMEKVEQEVLRSEANIWYLLPEPRHELLAMLLNNRPGDFIDCIVAHFETLTKFIPVMDEISHSDKRGGA